ncbi:MAG TPA: DUF6174 domain-containing protein [Longimicrobiaceae bacterium]|jgi:hypothetical protein
MTTTRRTAKLAFAALATLAVQACATDATTPTAAPGGERPAAFTGPYPSPATSAYQLQKNRGKWAYAGIDDYRYTIRQACYCFTPTYQVEVIDGEVVSVTSMDDPFGGGSGDTVPGLFDRIQAAMDANPDGLAATYDDVLGYPTSLSVDPSSYVLDDEGGWVVESFEVIQ